MSDTTFSSGTVITSAWLQDVNDTVYFSPSDTPTSNLLSYQIPWATYRGSGSDDTSALQALLTAGYNVLVSGTILANNLTAATDGQRIRASGRARIIKNANGPLITFSGADQEVEGVEFRGELSTPGYTGHNVVATGNNFRFINSGSRWAFGHALVLEGDSPLVLGTCDIIQTANGSTSYDIYCGVVGTAKLYGRIIGIRTTQSTGGIYCLNTGSFSVTACQFGKLVIAQDVSPPSGVNGGNFTGNRILGDTTVGISNSAFSGNTFSNVAVTFSSGTSGHSFSAANVLSSSATLTDSSNNSNIVDNRKTTPQTYTCSWTGATTDPVIGNGSLLAYYTTEGKKTTVSIRMVAGSTTTFGSGAWYFSLPTTPTANIPCIGQAQALDSGTNFRVGAVQSMTDSTARCIVTFDSDTASADSTRPFTWTTGDTLWLSLVYWS